MFCFVELFIGLIQFETIKILKGYEQLIFDNKECFNIADYHSNNGIIS